MPRGISTSPATTAAKRRDLIDPEPVRNTLEIGTRMSSVSGDVGRMVRIDSRVQVRKSVPAEEEEKSSGLRSLMTKPVKRSAPK